ncbi:MAG: hypothetical protein ACAH89_02095, partial [Rariglobus sp.]
MLSTLRLLFFVLLGTTAFADTEAWPANWSAAVSGTSWETEADTRFIRLTTPRPGVTVTLAHEIPVPAGAEVIDVRWRQRITNLNLGPNPGRYAKIGIEFLDATGGVLPADLSTPSYQRNSSGWETKFSRFAVPAGARSFKFSPTLVRVETGTYDLADISLAATSADAPLPTLARAAPPAAPATPLPATVTAP